jgi:hypothetical protein
MNYEVITNTAEKTYMNVSKLLIILLMLTSIVINGMTSYHLFRASSYDLSSLLIIASYLSIVLGIYVVTMRKPKSAVTK